jgi:hypothetical protein
MNEDLLTPLMGRLIDRAKAALAEAEADACGAEGIALLLDDETIVAAGAGLDPAGRSGSAAARALEGARVQSGRAIEAAAVALSDAHVATALPCAASREALQDIDPALPLVAKLRGRWVVRLLSELPGPTDRA